MSGTSISVLLRNAAAPRAIPYECKVGCSRNSTGHVGPEVDKDRISADNDFDLVIKQMWMQHLSTLPEDIAVRKRWRTGYWHRWYEDLDMSAIIDEDLFVALLEDEYCQDGKFN